MRVIFFLMFAPLVASEYQMIFDARQEIRLQKWRAALKIIQSKCRATHVFREPLEKTGPFIPVAHIPEPELEAIELLKTPGRYYNNLAFIATHAKTVEPKPTNITFNIPSLLSISDARHIINRKKELKRL